MHLPKQRAHPWHGISPGELAPELVNAFIELVPSDTVKYEIDKESGILMIDRPQKYSNHCPALYGFVPQTYCGKRVAALCADKFSRPELNGDGDPLDICVLSERLIPRGDILLAARPIGGLRMIDRGQVDDKIIGVLKDDALFGPLTDLSQCPKSWVDRLRHYFLTYKQIPNEGESQVEIAEIYGASEAKVVIRESIADYKTLSE